MRCRICGAENPPERTTCEACGAPLETLEALELNEKESITSQDNNSDQAPEKKNKQKKCKNKKDSALVSVIKQSFGESLAAAIIPIVAILLIAASLFLIIGSIVTNNGEPEIEDHYVTIFDEEKQVTYFLFKGKLVNGEIHGKCPDPYLSGSISDDGTVATVKSENITPSGSSFSLYVVTPNGISMISDSVDKEDEHFITSNDGKYVAYTLNHPGSLYIYDVNTKKSEICVEQKVSEFSFIDDCSSVAYITQNDTLAFLTLSDSKSKIIATDVKDHAILSDGDNVAYIKKDNSLSLYTSWSSSTQLLAKNAILICPSNNNKVFIYTAYNDNDTSCEGPSETYLHTGIKKSFLGEDLTPIALDDDAKYIYCLDRNDLLCIFDRSGSFDTVFTEMCSYEFSDDMSEVIGYTGEGLFIYSKAIGRKLISSEYSISPIPTKSKRSSSKFSERFYCSKNSEDKYTITYVDQNLNCSIVSEDITAFALSKSGNTLFCQIDNTIFYTNESLISSKKTPSVVCEGSLVENNYFIPNDTGALYLREYEASPENDSTQNDAATQNDDRNISTLYWCKNGEKKAISSSVVGDVFLSHDEYLFFTEARMTSSDDSNETEATTPADSPLSDIGVIKGDPLYCVKDGGDKKHISDNMCKIKISRSSAYFITPSEDYDPDTNPSFSVYGGVKGTKFKCIIESIKLSN